MTRERDSDLTAGAAAEPAPRVLTPYRATKIVNQALARAGVTDPRTGRPKTIGSPMLYIYADKQKFGRTRDPKSGRWNIDPESFYQWLDDYVERAKERELDQAELDRDES